MKKIGSAVVLVIVVAACGSSESQPKSVANSERPSCASHADCALTTFTGCCSCCEGAPRAMLKTELDRAQGQCHVVECKSCNADLECPKNERLDSFNVLCRAGTCVTEPKKTQ